MPEISRNRQNARYAEDVVNVKDFGAVGDGVTDDTAAIQAALDASSSTVVVPEGNYVCGTLSISSTLSLLMDENTTLQLAASTNAPLISATAGDKLEILGGKIDGNSANNTFSGTNGTVAITGVTEVVLKTRIDDTDSDAIRLTGATSGVVDCIITNSGNHGVYAIDVDNFKINGYIKDTQGSGAQIVPNSKDCDNCEINAEIVNPAQAGFPYIGAYFNSGDVYVVKNSSISSKVINSGYVGIFPGGDYNTVTSSARVDGAGSVTASGAHACWVHDSRAIRVEGIFRDAARYGVQVDKAHDVTVSATAIANGQGGFNAFNNTTATGRLQGADTNKSCIFYGCVAIDNGQSAANVYPGFYIDGFVDVSYIACQAHDYQGTQTQQRGILAATNALTSNVSIIGCNFTNNLSGNGINVAESYIAQKFGNYPNDASFIRLFDDCIIRAGSGTPEGTVTGTPGDLFLRTNGGTGTSLYVKETGTGNTGWVAK